MNTQKQNQEQLKAFLQEYILNSLNNINAYVLKRITILFGEERREELLNESVNGMTLREVMKTALTTDEFQGYKYHEFIKEYATYFDAATRHIENIVKLNESIERVKSNEAIKFILENDLHDFDPTLEKSHSVFLNTITNGMISLNNNLSLIHDNYEQSFYSENGNTNIDEILKYYRLSVDTNFQNFFIIMNERYIQSKKYEKKKFDPKLDSEVITFSKALKLNFQNSMTGLKDIITTSFVNVFKRKKTEKQLLAQYHINKFNDVRDFYEAYIDSLKSLRELQLKYNSFMEVKEPLDMLNSQVKLNERAGAFGIAILDKLNSSNEHESETDLLILLLSENKLFLRTLLD